MRLFVLLAASWLASHSAFAQEPADFVVRSRPDPQSLDYTPLTQPEPGARKKTPAEIEAAQAEMNDALARNRRAAARVKIPDAAAPAAPKKRKGD